MSRNRVHGEDLTYAEEHRHKLPQLYRRIGHRLDLADRDWTEFCNYCKAPVGIYEQVRDVGQDLDDKATTVTRKLAAAANVPAWLMAWRVERSPEAQKRLDELHRDQREIEARYPIVGFKAKPLVPVQGPLVEFTPAQWWEHVLAIHRHHHKRCGPANRQHPVDVPALREAQGRSPLWTPGGQLSILDQEAA